ncbi:MAG TPA: leucine-rich repeat domain-containing protein [Flavilitoribacter sp.]|nr:leucine-rich repeat domain-containing protein [Flavilitoribacter sp.]HMQ87104.1 leucine-rich repeat domain-containing protein [Flavilitoribacter sp.]
MSANQAAAWWNNLEDQWKKAFNESQFNRGPITATPTDEELTGLLEAPAIRFAGPRAQYPNMTFDLTNLSGIAGLQKVEVLVVIHQSIESIEELAGHTQLKSLFLLDNRIENLQPLQKLTRLEELYVQENRIKSLKPLERLTALKTVCCQVNEISDLDGLSVKHRDSLKTFYVLPNDKLPDHEVLKFERKVGIRCLKG